MKFCNYAGWESDGQMGFANQFILYFGLRADNGGESTFPFGQGWGQGPVAATIWDEWKTSEPDDMRMRASILNVNEELPNYVFGADKQMEECGLWSKKMAPILAKQPMESGKVSAWNKSLFWVAYDTFDKANNGDEMQGAHYQDLITIRFADVLLMQSELKEDAAGINRVRARAGLAPIPGYSLDLLQRERRHELCFEGRRWADIRRWGIAEEMLDKKNGVTIWNKGEQTVMRDGKYKERYKATNGFFPIPKAQVDLSAGLLEQNPGWDDASANFNGWNF